MNYTCDFVCRMRLIARSGLYPFTFSSPWQKRFGAHRILCLVNILNNYFVIVFHLLLVQYGLELIFVKNSHEFVDEFLKKPEFVELMRRLGALGDGNLDQSKKPVMLPSIFLFYICPRQLEFTLENVANSTLFS